MHAIAGKVNASKLNFRLTEFSEVRIAPVRYPGASDAQRCEESDPS
jgi:hypothetical protein